MGGASGCSASPTADRSPFFGPYACFTHDAVQLPLDVWWKFASPELAADSFLVDADEKRLAVVHKPLAVITHGYRHLQASHGAAVSPAVWTSCRWQFCAETGSACVRGAQALPVGSGRPFAEVEFAIAESAQCMCRLPRNGAAAAAAALRAGTARVKEQLPGAEALNALPTTEEGEEITLANGLFVRLRLRRIAFTEPCCRGDMLLLPEVACVDYFVRAGQDFVVDGARFSRRTRRHWRVGDRVQMLWAGPDEPDDGDYYDGRIVQMFVPASVRESGPGDATRAEQLTQPPRSPWETIKVDWDAFEDESSWVSAWEVVPAEAARAAAMDSAPLSPCFAELALLHPQGGDDKGRSAVERDVVAPGCVWQQQLGGAAWAFCEPMMQHAGRRGKEAWQPMVPPQEAAPARKPLRIAWKPPPEHIPAPPPPRPSPFMQPAAPQHQPRLNGVHAGNDSSMAHKFARGSSGVLRGSYSAVVAQMPYEGQNLQRHSSGSLRSAASALVSELARAGKGPKPRAKSMGAAGGDKPKAASRPSANRRLPAGTPVTMTEPPKRDWNTINCHFCNTLDRSLVHCSGSCRRSFHADCFPSSWDRAAAAKPDFYCPDCRAGFVYCAVCAKRGAANTALWKCRQGACGLWFHPECLTTLAHTHNLRLPGITDVEPTHKPRSGVRVVDFSCPRHFCKLCGKTAAEGGRMSHCWHCLQASHNSNCWSPDMTRLTDRHYECGKCTAALLAVARTTLAAAAAGGSAAPTTADSHAGDENGKLLALTQNAVAGAAPGVASSTGAAGWPLASATEDAGKALNEAAASEMRMSSDCDDEAELQRRSRARQLEQAESRVRGDHFAVILEQSGFSGKRRHYRKRRNRGPGRSVSRESVDELAAPRKAARNGAGASGQDGGGGAEVVRHSGRVRPEQPSYALMEQWTSSENEDSPAL